MFGSKKISKTNLGVGTLIARNTAIEGKVKFTGELIIEGVVDGDIISTEGQDSLVQITVDGKVQGEVHSPNVIINGHVQGDVYAVSQLVLASDAVVDGNVHYSMIEMEKGAQINGNMVYTEVAATASETSARPGKVVKPEVAAESATSRQEQAAD